MGWSFTSNLLSYSIIEFSTLILASTHPVTSGKSYELIDYIIVIAGATCGYIVSTLCGVLGGNFFAKVISPRVVSLLGGVLFLLFAVQILITKDWLVFLNKQLI